MSWSTIMETKVVDPENELNNVQRIFKKLGPQCGVEKRAHGLPQLAMQEKQISILKGELEEQTLCISMASKGRHALHDRVVKTYISSALQDTDALVGKLRDQRLQLTEVNCLNYLTQKRLLNLSQLVRSEADELATVENALNRLKQIENRLELATKRFCVVNFDNSQIRQEIHRLLVERNNFNVQWSRTITKLVKGKLYLLDIFEVAANAFADRDEYCLRLEALKWKGLYGLNRDISEMQQFECELNHLTKLERFLRVKGSRRICEADEKEERRRQLEVESCRAEIARLDDLLDQIFKYSKLDLVPLIVSHFKATEVINFSKFELLSKTLHESVDTRREVLKIRGLILDQRVKNQERTNTEKKRLDILRLQLKLAKDKTKAAEASCKSMDNKITSLLSSIQELTKIANCNLAPVTSMLGYRKAAISVWNYKKHLTVLEIKAKALVQIAYGSIPSPEPGKGRKAAVAPKLVQDPEITILRPNRIDKLVNYLPCAYCVEDYMINQVYDTPAKVATEQYVQEMFHLEEPNTDFGIFSLTIPTKRHPYRGTNV